MHAELPLGVAHRVMTTQDLNIPDASAGPDGLHAARLLSEPADVSRDFQQAMDRSLPRALDGPSTLSGQTFSGLGFTLADFSGGDLPSAGHRSQSFDVSPIKPARETIGSGTVIDLGWDNRLLPDVDLEQRLIRQERVDGFGRTAPARNGQGQGEKAIQSSLKPPVGSWEIPAAILNGPEAMPSNSIGSLSSGLWDFDETFGWLLLGMFMVPIGDEKEPRPGGQDNRHLRLAIH
jgi:hypothetical protein